MLEAMLIRSPPPTRTCRTIPPPGDGQFYLWSESSNWRYLNLLAVNQQLRAEAKELTAQLQKTNKIRFEIDILASGYIYTPKWTLKNLALQPNSSLDLHCNLKILSTEAFRPIAGGADAGHAFRTLLNFLSRFLFQGPTFLHNDGATAFSTPGPFYLNKLSLDVSFEDYYTPATHPDTVVEIFRMMKALSRLDTARKYIGKLEVTAKWSVRGEEFCRQREWDLAGPCFYSEEQALEEETWAALGFHFGEAWVNKYASGRSLSV